MIRILLADDHTIMREGLKHLFKLTGDIEVVGEAANGAQALVRLEQGGVDLLLLDMTMPGLSGDDLVARVRHRHPDLPVLVLSMHSSIQIARLALKAGASGYLTKDRDPEMLLSAIRRIANGGRFIDPLLAEQMFFEPRSTGDRAPHEMLSEREFQVMQLLAEGMTVSHIADQLAISVKTTSTYKARLMEKMEFDSTAELVRYAVDYGLVQ